MTKRVVEKFSVGSSGGYEWTEFHVYQHPREPRKFVTWSDSGCSCNWYEAPTLEQLEACTPEGKREVYAEFSKWWDSIGTYYDCSGTKIDNLERLRSSL